MNERTSEIMELMGDVDSILAGAPESPEATKPQPRTLLQVWAELLSNIEKSADEPVSMPTAVRLVGTYPQIRIQECESYLGLYHSKLLDMRDILTQEIASDKKCFERAETDAVDNRHHYLNLLTQWQILLKSWEQDWSSTADDAHLELAASADAGAFMLGENGIVAHLGEIGFEFSTEDAQEILAAVMSE